MVAEVASIEVTLRLLGAERFQASMRDSGSITEQTGARVKRAMDGIASSTDRASASSSGLLRSSSAINSVALSALRAETSILGLNRAFTLLGTAVGGLAGGVALNAFKNYADTATSIQNRLAAVIPVQAQRAAIDQQIFDTAQRTRTSYEATANIFSRMTLSASTLGASQSEILRAVEITQKALQAGGATSAESASIATQLSQALGSGKLAGDELKSIAENSPVLIQAIAREFGVAVGALKDMGSEGKLTSDRVFKAILNAGKEVDDVFARTTPTIAAGIQQIDNALTRYIGNVDKSLGVTKALTGGLEFVAKNLDTIGDSAALAVAALAGPLGARLLGGAGSRVAAPFRAAGADARAGLSDANSTAEAARAARVAAQGELQRAQQALQSLEGQPKFRQAGGDLQRDYERQAAQVDKLREAATKTAEKESAALLARADAETTVAQVSEAASKRVDAAKEKLGRREARLNELLAQRREAEQAAGSRATPSAAGTVNAERRVFEAINKARGDSFQAELHTVRAQLADMSRQEQDAAFRSLRDKGAIGFSEYNSPRYRARVGDAAIDLGPGPQHVALPAAKFQEYAESLAAAEKRAGDAQAGEREKAGKKLAALDEKILQARAEVAGQTEKLDAAQARANETQIKSAERKARVQADLDAKAIAATAQRRAAQEALGEAENRLGGLAGQVGTSAAQQRTQAIQQVEAAQSVLNRAYFAEQEAMGRAADATTRASAGKIALAGAARAVTGAVSGMINMLGGPLGAALTVASVGLVGYELYQARAAARVEEHTKALDALADRMRAIKAQQASGDLRADVDIVADRLTLAQAAKAARDRRDSLLSVFKQADDRNSSQSDLGGGVTVSGTLDKAAARLGVNLSEVVEKLRTLPAHHEDAAAAAETLNRVLTEAAMIDPGYAKWAVEAERLGLSLKDAGTQVRDFEEVRRAAAEAAKGRTGDLELSLDDFADADIDAITQQGRDAADAFSQGFTTQVPTGSQISDSIAQEGERAKAAFQEALGQIDTETLDAALRAVGSSLETVKGNLDGTKVASGEAGAASIAFAHALQLIQANQPDLSATIAQISAVTNAYRQMIGLQSVAVAGPLAPGSDKMTPEQQADAVAKQREASLKRFNERLEAADKTPAARQRRIGRALPGLTDAEVSRLDAAENPGRKGRGGGGGRKSPEQRSADTLAKKLEELDQDASVAALNDFDQKTVRFAQSAKVASDQIQAFIAAAKSGDLSSVPPVMQEIYDKMRLLEGVKLGKAALDELFPGRLLAEQIESVRRAAASSPEIAANLSLIETRLREKNAPEWAKDTTSAFSEMVKSVSMGTASMADALSTLKTRIVSLALDAALKPLERFFTSAISGGSGGFDFLGMLGIGGGGGGGGGGDSPTGGVRLFHEGGKVGVTPAPLRSLPPSVIARAPRFHTGLGSNEFAAILERGERVLTERQDMRAQATMSALADAASGAAPQMAPTIIEGDNVTVQVSNTGASPQDIAAAIARNNAQRDRDLAARLKANQQRYA